MRCLLSIILLTISSVTFAADVKEKSISKNWFISIGPVFSDALLGTNGTKYALEFAYRTGLSEKVDITYFYNGSFNTASQGSTGISVFGAGFLFYTNERTSDSSFFFRTDIGYGGGNRYTDSSFTLAAGFGFDFFRTKDFTFEVNYKHQRVATTNVSNLIGSLPAVNQLMFGIIF
ncbi:MAG: hypothetical protein IPM57_07310 [Oligoflexia bacterium]|nr:hypothetical protein [Oligoflexia bacterium]